MNRTLVAIRCEASVSPSVELRFGGAGGCRSRAAQRGVALIVALILLVVITLVGLAAIGTTILQNKAASNQYDRQIAFQSAEAALRVGAAMLPDNIANPLWSSDACEADPITKDPINPSAPGGCHANPFDNSLLPADAVHTVATGSRSTTAFTTSAVAPMQPQFVVQSLGARVNPTAVLGFGNTANSHNYMVPGGNTTTLYYRITARSCDPAAAACSNRAIVTLQTVVKRG